MKPPPPECRVPDALLVGDEGRAPAPLADVVVRPAAGRVAPLAGVARLPANPVAPGVLLATPAVLAGLGVPLVELRAGLLLLEGLVAALLLALRAGLDAALLDEERGADAVDPVVSKDSLSNSKNPMLFLPRQYGCTGKSRLCDTVRRRVAIRLRKTWRANRRRDYGIVVTENKNVNARVSMKMRRFLP